MFVVMVSFELFWFALWVVCVSFAICVGLITVCSVLVSFGCLCCFVVGCVVLMVFDYCDLMFAGRADCACVDWTPVVYD